MKLLNERNQVLDVLQRWKLQYPEWTAYHNETHLETQRKLESLDLATASADDVEQIIGNPTWVRPMCCDECGNYSWLTVQLGDEADYESSTAIICSDCLQEALNLTFS